MLILERYWTKEHRVPLLLFNVTLIRSNKACWLHFFFFSEVLTQLSQVHVGYKNNQYEIGMWEKKHCFRLAHSDRTFLEMSTVGFSNVSLVNSVGVSVCVCAITR